MFQALQAAVSRLRFSSAVLPKPMNSAAISEIISDILRLDEGLGFIFASQQIENEVVPLPQPLDLGHPGISLCHL
jgi:hypothetical protein